MACTLLLATLALSLAGASAQANAGEYSSKLLKLWLGSAVSMSSSAKGAAIEYCPDNTCERLTATPKASKGELEDFTFLYLLTKSTYVYLKDKRPDEEAGAVSRVTNSYGRECPNVAGKPDVECVLKLLQHRASIRLYFIRYDEGEKCTVPEALMGKPPTSKAHCVRAKSAA
jgi:hypothetical protein